MENGYSYLDRLNEQQRAAVVNTEGPMLVVAGAGSGKTTVLTTRIAYLLDALDVAPWRILALTFTNKAAREMRERIEQMVGIVKARSLWMGTFHSIFSRILRQEAHVFGFTSNYTVYQPSDTRSLLKAIVKERGLDDKVYKPQLLAARISEAKNMLVTPNMYRQHDKAYARDDMDRVPLTGEIYQEYFNRCHTANAMDFDDMLLYTYLLFERYPEVRAKYAEKFQYILVDEFQDTNFAQMEILRQLSGPEANVCVVGDDAQSIYSFRGARIDNILGFDKVFGGTQIFRLERNYRSTQCIVNAANSLISKNKNQIPKKIFSENEEGSPLILNELTSDQEEGEMVSRRINTLRREGVKLSEIAILYRTNGQSRIMEECLRKHNIPYIVYGNHSFYEKKSVRDVMAYLRLVVNPSDEEALRRIINFPTRGIGSTTLDKIFACAQEGQTSAWNVVQQPDFYGLSVNNGTKARLQGFASMIKNFIVVNEAGADAYQLGQQVMKESGLIAQAQADITTEGREVMDDYSSLLSGMSQFVQNQREQGEELTVGMTDYLQEVALLTDSDNDTDNDGEAVRMMTVHVAKGLEFDVVFITGMEQGLFPSAQCLTPREHEEERRLFFVAITRARKRCYLSCAKMRFRFGKSDWFEPSEFLKDIDPKYIYQENSTRGQRRPNLNEYVSFEESGTAVTRFRHRYNTASPEAPTVSFSRRRPLAPESNLGRPRGMVGGPLGRGDKTTSDLLPGTSVEHATFGVGTVERIEDSMAGQKAVVNFVNCGQKILLLKYAKLKIVEQN